ncbi:MAG: hypothetical protein NTAFB05_04390 [Nitrobacter sp.]
MVNPASKSVLTELADDAREKVGSLPHGPERSALLKAIWQADNAIILEKWVNSPGLQPPK